MLQLRYPCRTASVRLACRSVDDLNAARPARSLPAGCRAFTGFTPRFPAHQISQRHTYSSTIRTHVPQAAKQADEADPSGKGLTELATLGMLFAAWYLANIVFNIYNKQVLSPFPCPLTCTVVQFGVGSLIAASFWITGFVKKPAVTQETLGSVLPLAVVHTLGNLLTNVSLGAVAVSFTHTIKALEPFFSVALSAAFLGERPAPLVLLTLLPIVGGVAMASVSEVSFNWRGFLAAMGSNLTFQSRNVLSKKLMVKKDSLDNVNLFSIITVMAFLLLLPVALAVEGVQLTPAALTARGITDHGALWFKVVAAGVCFHAYQQVSYAILSRVSPVTHSIGNCVKRVIVIVASVVVFQHPMSTQCMIGTGTALFGVFLYSQAKRLSKNHKPATA